MLWLNKHARLRNSLSPYIDGRLTASEITALESHLASCEACRRELDDLRATVSALHEMPQVEAPRSFAITPEMLEPKAGSAARPMPMLGTGMRLAGAAVAVSLAVILVGDLTLGDNGGASPEAGSRPAEESRATEMFNDSATSRSGESGAYAPPSTSADSSTTQSNAGAAVPCPPAGVPASTGSAAGGAAGGGGAGTAAGRGSDETPVATATTTPEPAPTSTPSPQSPNVAAICGNVSNGAVAPVAPAVPSPSAVNAQPGAEGSQAATRPAANEDGGISTLRAAEIVLAGMLVAIVAAIVLEAAVRRRRTA